MIALQAFSGIIFTFGFGGGILINTGSGASWIVKLISYISPLRYASEIILRRLTEYRTVQEDILEYYGYTYGLGWCFGLMIAFTVFCFFLGWFILVMKNRNL